MALQTHLLIMEYVLFRETDSGFLRSGGGVGGVGVGVGGPVS